MSDVKSILAIPSIYRLFSNIVGGKVARFRYIREYIKPNLHDRILDIACGTGDILRFLPNVDYLGFDMSQKYIDAAIKCYGNRGTFLCKKISKDAINKLSTFDIVLATGVLHHLTDDETLQLFELARSVLRSGGRLVTFDGCYIEGQSSIARYLLSKDRGQYVRTREGYLALASKIFTNINVNIRHDLLRIPYTHIIMECTT